MSLRDELAKWFAANDHRNWSCGELADRLAPRLEAKLREAQAEAVERLTRELATHSAKLTCGHPHDCWGPALDPANLRDEVWSRTNPEPAIGECVWCSQIAMLIRERDAKVYSLGLATEGIRQLQEQLHVIERERDEAQADNLALRDDLGFYEPNASILSHGNPGAPLLARLERLRFNLSLCEVALRECVLFKGGSLPPEMVVRGEKALAACKEPKP